eukprot:510026_1
MGKSRSSTIVIAYLLSKKVELNKLQTIRFNYIYNELLKHNKTDENKDTNMIQMKLNTAYYYVQTYRNLIEPNNGFILQLSKWEQICNNGHNTLHDTPKFTSNKHIKKLSKNARKLELDTNGNIEITSSCILL